MTLRAIVFDFDGVIANTEPLHFRAFRDTLLPLGLSLSEHDYYARYLGFDNRGVFEAVGRNRGTLFESRRLAELVSEKADRMEGLERDQSVLFPGAARAIARCAAAVPLAIASGALRAEIDRVLEGVGLARHFAAIVSAEDTPLSKPAPDPYLRAVRLLSEATAPTPPLSPADCVAVEDSIWGVRSARAAGLMVVAVCQTYSAADLEEADLVIPSLEELDLELIGRL